MIVEAKILKGGIHIDWNCSKITSVREGIFIEFAHGGHVMRALDRFVKKYGLLDEGEEIPSNYTGESSLEHVIRNRDQIPLLLRKMYGDKVYDEVLLSGKKQSQNLSDTDQDK